MLPVRRRLSHEPPLRIDPAREVWFITVCCATRARNQLADPMIGPRLLKSVAFRNASGIWHVWLIVLMPEHVHFLVSFPATSRGIAATVGDWKRFTARRFKVGWQENFFDHRLRSDESFHDKALYILQNPVRAGLAAHWQDWPWRWWPDDESITGLPH